MRGILRHISHSASSSTPRAGRKRPFNRGLISIGISLLIAVMSLIGTGSFVAANAATATITIKVGGDRTGTSSSDVTNLQGVVLGLYKNAADSSPVAQCTSQANGNCVITFTTNNSNQGYYYVKRISAPAGWHPNDALSTGYSSWTKQDYIFQTPYLWAGSNTTVSSTQLMDENGSNGVWQVARDNKELPKKCGIKVAMLLKRPGFSAALIRVAVPG